MDPRIITRFTIGAYSKYRHSFAHCLFIYLFMIYLIEIVIELKFLYQFPPKLIRNFVLNDSICVKHFNPVQCNLHTRVSVKNYLKINF